MGKNFFDIVYKKEKSNPTVDCKYAPYELPFYKTDEQLGALENFVAFVKAVEKLVRTSPYYKDYVKYIKGTVGLNRCQVLGNITDDMAPVEMHHGPILTLFDIVCIVVDSLLKRHKAVTTFDVAKIVMEEHRQNNVQIIMASETVHEQLHDFDGPFISVKQAFGNLPVFLKKYKLGLGTPEIQKINRYLHLCEEYESYDKDLFKLSKLIDNVDSDIEFNFMTL